MSDALTWQILVVDDDQEICDEIQQYLEGRQFGHDNSKCCVTTLVSFADAMRQLESGKYDIVILDVRQHGNNFTDDDDLGRKIFDQIRARRFIPIIFYTGIPAKVTELKSPVVKVIEKTETIRALESVIGELIDTRLLTINRALISHVETIQRQYMWDFVAENWNNLDTTTDQVSVAYLLARRLALSLQTGIAPMVDDLGGDATGLDVEETVHPMHYYIMPPLDKQVFYAGDIFRGTVDGQAGYFVLLTPSCDLVQDKVERTVLACCAELTSCPECQQWGQNRESKNKKRALEDLFANRKDRHHFLPGVLSMPHLLVDFQNVKSIALSDLRGLTRVTSLDSPYREHLLSRFVRYMGRLGTPDLKLEMVWRTLNS